MYFSMITDMNSTHEFINTYNSVGHGVFLVQLLNTQQHEDGLSETGSEKSCLFCQLTKETCRHAILFCKINALTLFEQKEVVADQTLQPEMMIVQNSDKYLCDV